MANLRAMKNQGILCYATAEDRIKLAEIVKAEHAKSGSAWILQQIRNRHAELFPVREPEG